MTAAVPEPTLQGKPDPLWVRMVMDVADQLWQSGNKRASGDLHEALRLSAEHVVEVRERAVEEALEAAAVRVEAKIVHVPDAAVDSGGFETGMDVGCEIAYAQAARIVRAGGRP